MFQFQGLLGIVVILFIAWLLSVDRKHISLKKVAIGIVFQFIVALMVFKIPFFEKIFLFLAEGVRMLERSTEAGTSFVLGYLGGAPVPFEVAGSHPEATPFILAFKALPLLLVVSALSAILFYLRILPLIIKVCSQVFERILNMGGVLSLGASSNIFFGMDAAPFVIKPHIKNFSESELFCFMTLCMATVASSVMVLYNMILEGVVANPIGHIIAASIINVPAAVTIARIMIPETQELTHGELDESSKPTSILDAICKGTEDGLKVFISICGMLIVLVALVHLANECLAFIPTEKPITLQSMLGYVMMPFMWLIGIPLDQAHIAGTLMSTKTVLNELIAYVDLSKLPEGTLDPRSQLMMIYAMCGFANFGSLGILIGALTIIAPERRPEILKLSPRCLVAGTFSTLMTGAIVGIIYAL